MSRFLLDDDFFSPVRLDISSVNGSSFDSEGCSSDFSNADEYLAGVGENKVTLEENVLLSDQKNELKPKEGNIKSRSINTCTPVSKNSSDKSIANRKSLKLKLEKKYKIESLESGQKKADESLCKENISNSQIVTCDTSEKLDKKSRSASLPSKNKNTTLKDVKKKQKDFIQSSKCDSTDKVQKIRTNKQSLKKLTENSPSLQEYTSDINLKGSSVMSTESKENTSNDNSGSKKSNHSSCQKEKSTVNQMHSSYEESIKKMVHWSISSESDKLRQHMHMQQMSFYREMNKIKDTMERQHFETTEHLLKVVEELMQVNASLKQALTSKD